MLHLTRTLLIVRPRRGGRNAAAVMAGTSSIAIGVTFARVGVRQLISRANGPTRPVAVTVCASQAVIIAGILAGAAWKMLGFRCKKKPAPGRKLFCPARDPVAESRNERPRPDLNTPDRRRGGSVAPAGDFRRGSASSSNPSEIELTRSGSDSKARSPFWGGASP